MNNIEKRKPQKHNKENDRIPLIYIAMLFERLDEETKDKILSLMRSMLNKE